MLRFKKEDNSQYPTWEEKTIKNCTEFVKDGTHASFLDADEGFPLLSAKDIANGKILVPEDSRIISKSDFNEIYKKYNLQENDVLITIVGTIGRLAIVKADTPKVAFQRSVGIMRPNQYVLPTFFMHALSSASIQTELLKKQNKGAQGGVYLGTLEQIKLRIPSLEEQQKIADFLSKIDDMILIQSQQLDALKEQKKGVMQKIFNQEVRFKDENDEDFPDWEKKYIGDLINQENTKNKKDEDLIVLSVSNRFGFIKQSEQFEDREVASDDRIGYKIVQKDFFAYNPARINVGSIGRLKTFDNGIVSPMYIVFSVKKDILCEDFMECFVQTEMFKKEMTKRLEGSVRMCLSFEGLEEIPIYLPSINEQKRITDLFSQYDRAIENKQKQLDMWNTLKKGLMQELFDYKETE